MIDAGQFRDKVIIDHNFVGVVETIDTTHRFIFDDVPVWRVTKHKTTNLGALSFRSFQPLLWLRRILVIRNVADFATWRPVPQVDL
jgi:hypothetical protein